MLAVSFLAFLTVAVASTLMASGVPLYAPSGWKVTLPVVESIVYVPTIEQLQMFHLSLGL